VQIARLALAPREVSARNPYFHLLEQGLAACGLAVAPDASFTLRWLWRARHDVAFLHFHWRPDAYYVWLPPGFLRRRRLRFERLQGALSWVTLGWFAARMLAARALGYVVVWTIHELYPAETGRRSPGSVSRKVDLAAAKMIARSSRVLLAHNRATAAQAEAALGESAGRVEVVPHGSYVGVYPRGRDRDAVRAELHIPVGAFVFLCFGTLRPDKEIPFLLDAFRSVRPADVVLVIAGRPDDAASAWSVVHAFRADARIRPLLGAVPNRRIAELFAAADAAVSPRNAPWTSGSLILALSLGVPVVAARLPVYEELLAGERAGWLFRPGDAESLSRTLERAAADPAEARAKGAEALRQAERLPGWDAIAERTASLVLGAAAGTAPGRATEALHGAD
jgi:glycosyltransferase involved in cell wall biosynthesis